MLEDSIKPMSVGIHIVHGKFQQRCVLYTPMKHIVNISSVVMLNMEVVLSSSSQESLCRRRSS